MKIILLVFATLILAGCNTTITDAQQPVRNFSATNNYANEINARHFSEHSAPTHGTPDRQ